jgi:ABC-type sugar transport system ATPase subunit/ribose/xylose/arabinose/galactoside ABC-type transport system permease subunit
MQRDLPQVQLRHITRSFPGVLAVDDFSLELTGGSVYALVGANGAGKSTLIKVLSGILAPDAGEILIDNEPVELRSARQATRAGIVAVHQEAEFFSTLSIAENVALATGYPVNRWGLIDRRAMTSESIAHLQQISDAPSPASNSTVLSVAQRHMLQIATAIAAQPRVLILDEPSSSLSQSECEWLFENIERLKSLGTAVLYVSHRLDEVQRLADYITVMRDGAHVWTRAAKDVSRETMVEAMVVATTNGGDSTSTAAEERKVHSGNKVRSGTTGNTAHGAALQVESLSDREEDAGISLEVQPGEVLGVYGLIGSGRTEFAHVLYGIRRRRGGRVLVDGQVVNIRSPRDAVREGLAYLPEDRLTQAILPGRSVRSNAVISTLSRWANSGLANARREETAAASIVERFDVRCRATTQPIQSLSGGNQQKVVMGRCFLAEPRVLVLDEPTRGVDIRARDDIHAAIRQLASQGTAVVLISSELSEVLDYSDRIVVFCEGSNVAEFEANGASAAEVADAAFPETQPGNSIDASTSTTNHVDRRSVPNRQHRWWMRGEIALAATVLALIAILYSSSSGFSLLSVAGAASTWVLLSLAAACVILVGGIDISIGSMLALSAAVAAMILKLPLPPAVSIPLAIVAAMSTGVLTGCINAWISLAGRVHPIVVTLGTMTIYRGIVILMLGRNALTGLPKSFGYLAIHPESGFRVGILVAGIVVVAAHFWLTGSPLGRSLYAVGSNPRAAELAGISKKRTWLLAFGVAGALVGLAGTLELASSTQMQGRLGQGWELVAIAAAVIGGVSISGGHGTVFGVVLGAVLLRLTNSVLVHWGVADHQEDLIIGCMILMAVMLDLAWKRRAGQKATVAS